MVGHYSPIVSIITPVYNCKKFLTQCVDSILAQSYNNFELLLIDDGSTDGSSKICDAYSRTDRRISVYHQSNKGVSSARNLGIEKASGEWITFVDSDDILKSDALYNLLQEIDHDIEFIMCGYEYLQNGKVTYTTAMFHNRYKCNRDEGISQMYTNEYWSWFICSKLFRNRIIQDNQIYFDETIYLGEDRLFIAKYICSMTGSFAFASDSLYIYRLHETSAEGMSWIKYDERNITGLVATVKMYNLLKEIPTTNYNKYLALSDLVNSYRTQRAIIKRLKLIESAYRTRIDAIFYSAIPKYKYYLFIIVRKVVTLFK